MGASVVAQHKVVADFFAGFGEFAVELSHQRMRPVDRGDEVLHQDDDVVSPDDVSDFMNEDFGKFDRTRLRDQTFGEDDRAGEDARREWAGDFVGRNQTGRAFFMATGQCTGFRERCHVVRIGDGFRSAQDPCEPDPANRHSHQQQHGSHCPNYRGDGHDDRQPLHGERESFTAGVVAEGFAGTSASIVGLLMLVVLADALRGVARVRRRWRDGRIGLRCWQTLHRRRRLPALAAR